MKWIPCTIELLEKIEVQRSQQHQDIRNDLGPLVPHLPGFARALVDGECVLGAIGVWPQWRGVGAAWALLSAEARQHPFVLARGVRRWLRYIEERDAYHRIQASCDAEDLEARDFLAWLGFAWEGRMRQYGMAREDHILVALVR